MMNRFYRQAPPGVDAAKLGGVLIVIEGMDSSGRSTQIQRLTPWLERRGQSVVQVALKRSELVGDALERAKQGNVLSPRTMSLFYATDFYDQLENVIVPALRAGAIVLADRYIFTLMARDLVRGASAAWLESMFSMALVPAAVFYLQTSWRNLVDRTLQAHAGLDYWESGMDLGLSRDWFESYVMFQRRMNNKFAELGRRYDFITINGNRTPSAIEKELRGHIEQVLARAGVMAERET